MSGRGLGHTGGTLDKLESIPGFKVNISEEAFIDQVNDIKLAIIGQTRALDPADKKMYALRDVTGTVNSIPLIASSIMSKKLAAGADAILLDVKYGDGAFMKTTADAKVLAETMIAIGKHLGKNTKATISNMNQPLGYAIGNALEVIEAINTLKGQGPEDFTTLCKEEAETMLLMAKAASSREEACAKVEEAISSGQALAAFKAMVKAQGGDETYIDHPEKFPKANYQIEIPARESGYVEDLEALRLGLVSMKLGGGRARKDDVIDHQVGLVLHKKIGDHVEKSESLATVHCNVPLNDALKEDIYKAYHLTSEPVTKPQLIEGTLE
jgi:pyrimidine-nucleoside phosphorylase